MIYSSDINQLISEWTEMLDNPIYPQPYKDALFECCYELNKLVDKSIKEELEYNDMIESSIADSYLSSIEAHEVA